jgi:Kef-type K+ transport system membrane component KefB
VDVLAAITACIAAAALLAFLARMLGQPLVLGYVAAGALLGPHVGLHVVHDEAAIEHISEIGLILLLFLIGLEISLPRLLQAGRVITASGLLQPPLCAAVAWFCLGPIAVVTGGTFDRLYLAIAAAISSTLIVVKLLSDKYELASFGGRVTVGILVFQDLFAIAFLAVQPNLEDPRPAMLAQSLAGVLLIVAGAFLVARWAMPRFFRTIATSSELLVVSAMAWCLLVAEASKTIGLSREMGALVAGVVIAGLPYGSEIVSRVGGVRDFFLTLFFVSLGLKVPAPSADVLGPAALVTAVVVGSRFVTMVPIFAALRLDTRTASVVAVNLGQVSEFALVFFALGLGLGHVSKAAASIVLYAVLLTAVLSTYAILYSHDIASAISRLLPMLGLRGRFEVEADDAAASDDSPDLFVLGATNAGLALVRRLDRLAPELKRRIVAIDFSPETLDSLALHGVRRHYGDVANVETLRHAGIERASVILSLLSDWILKGTSNADILLRARSLAPGARIVVTADNAEDADALYRAGADYVVVPAALTAEHLQAILADPSPPVIEAARKRQTADLFDVPD